nr:TolC family protein [uncultured Flavobacterium sp.]
MKSIVKIIIAILVVVPSAFAQQKNWTLQDCIDYATEHNITIKQSEYNKQTAEVTYTQSKYSRFPSVSGSASQSVRNGSSVDPITSRFVTQTINSTSLGVGAQVTLFNGNYINNTIKQNELYVKQNEFYISEAKNNILLSVTEAYLKAVYYKEGIDVAQTALESSKEQVKQMQQKLKAGSVAGIDVADLQTQLANDEYSLVTAQNNYLQQLITLKQLLEIEPAQEFDIATPDLPEQTNVVPNLNEVYNNAVATMPEVKGAKLQTDIYNYDIKKAKAGYLPTLSMNAGLYSGYTNSQDYSFNTQLNNNFYQSAGLSLSIPIFSNYKNKAAVEKAKISVELSKLSTQSEVKQLYLKVESAWQNAVSVQSEMKAAEALRNSSKQAYEMAQKKSDLGSLSATDLLVSKNTYLSAEQKYLQTKFSNALYHQLLQFYQGNEIKI